LIDALPATTNCYSTGISSDGTAISAICGGKAVVYLNGSLIELGDGEVNGVNSKGQAVGNSIGGSHALMWSFSSGSVTQKDLGTLGGSWVTARAINDAGEVLGTSANAQQIFHAFLWSPKKKTMTDLTPDARSFDGGGINAAGQGAGDLFDGASHAAFFDHGKIVDLGILPGYKAAIARGLNNAGRVIGHSFGTTAVTRATVWVLK
jgi:probable HAF family extracellular repeat protein